MVLQIEELRQQLGARGEKCAALAERAEQAERTTEALRHELQHKHTQLSKSEQELQTLRRQTAEGQQQLARPGVRFLSPLAHVRQNAPLHGCGGAAVKRGMSQGVVG
jgi:chromosome segregation ATPase